MKNDLEDVDKWKFDVFSNSFSAFLPNPKCDLFVVKKAIFKVIA
jgi:hypothetical protein